jgi:hypothetical protein
MTIVHIDTEAIRIVPATGGITVWEIGMIVDGDEYLWQVRPDMHLADHTALKVGRFETRFVSFLRYHPSGTALCVEHPDADEEGGLISGQLFAKMIAELTAGADLWGSNPAFDIGHLDTLLGIYGIAPSWHYHPNDIPSMAAGWCAAKRIVPVSAKDDGRIRSDDWSRAIGINPDDYDRHTALGDCRWTLAQHNAMLGGGR